MRETLLIAAGIAASIAGICFFGIQLDRRKVEDRKEEDRKAEERRKTGKTAKKISNKPARPA